MDAGIADAINRRDVTLIFARLDALDLPQYGPTDRAWHESPMSDTLMRDDEASRPDRAWLIGTLAQPCRGIAFDGAPADCDWDNFFSHVRAAIQARRDPPGPSVHAAEIPVLDGVGSQ